MELLSVPLVLTCSGVGVAGPSDCPQTIAISPGETPVASYEAALVTAETTGCGTLMALCASGITNSVSEYAGNVAVRLLPATLMSEVWRTMAARFVWLYCHTCAVPAAAKLARLMVSLISPADSGWFALPARCRRRSNVVQHSRGACQLPHRAQYGRRPGGNRAQDARREPLGHSQLLRHLADSPANR